MQNAQGIAQAMYVDRYQIQRRRRFSLPSCGCSLFLGLLAALAVFALISLAPSIPEWIERVQAGEPLLDIDLDAILNPTTEPETNTMQELPPMTDTENPESITLNFGDIASSVLVGLEEDMYSINMGNTAQDTDVIYANFQEDGLRMLCDEYSDICGTTNDEIRNASFDIQDNGESLIKMELFNESYGGWQFVDVVLEFDGSNQVKIGSFYLSGIPISSLPGLQGRVNDIEGTLNQVLRETTVMIDGTEYNLQEIHAGNDELVFVLR